MGAERKRPTDCKIKAPPPLWRLLVGWIKQIWRRVALSWRRMPSTAHSIQCCHRHRHSDAKRTALNLRDHGSRGFPPGSIRCFRTLANAPAVFPAISSAHACVSRINGLEVDVCDCCSLPTSPYEALSPGLAPRAREIDELPDLPAAVTILDVRGKPPGDGAGANNRQRLQ
jgi:hypothetical protein